MAERRPDALQTLERGLEVIEAFSSERPALTLSDVARMTGLTRATARRILLTLEGLGYARSDGRLFSLTPRVLRLGGAFISSLGLDEVAQPLIRDLANELEEPVSIGTLDWPDVVYIARVYPQRRIYASALSVGSRLPAHATALGRILLAALPDAEIDAHLVAPLERYTRRTNTDPAVLRQILEGVRERGWVVADQEIELGIRSVAAPIRDRAGGVVAALTASTTTPRATLAELRERLLPRVIQVAEEITTAAASQNATVTAPPHRWTSSFVTAD